VRLTNPKTSHTFAAKGRYTVTLTVYDGAGLYSRYSRSIEIERLAR